MIDFNLLAAMLFGGVLLLLTLASIMKKPGAKGMGKGPILFIDCDDTLYRNEKWEVATMITDNIENYVTKKLGLPKGRAYELYKKHGTCLRGLQNEGFEFDLEDFLKTVHELPNAKEYIKEDPDLKEVLNRVKVDKWVFTASTNEHATRCIKLLGISSCFENPIIDVRAANWHTKHSEECYVAAMRIAGVSDPDECYIVDDSWSNIKAAKKMGWKTALVGFKSRDGRDAKENPDADHVIADLKDLPSVWPELFHEEKKADASVNGGLRKRKSSRSKRRKAD
mmetsp:Transcript_3016/g.4367  ORF Transcript_3016/g.4367 Transcript_3016/m.4367 type:complete len:281 (-) Transcript_3016:3-845(-)|eukprot:CAMPEP_0184493546 /NCGR_PEP_ID=MMETSP0113_2-20130426/26255_1 /TAXON_ID=91329 /ORGANISM="Norrisiella sphaerica, Strain BC52" /LENGTH=280 /DNA_ID=CAMNT_0026878841 /DNA_START=56 /DNA_END=898 /DNA_ORIENTATION=+